MAGGWAFVTSYDDHFVHDVTMISYILFSIIYHFLYPYVYFKVCGRSAISYRGCTSPTNVVGRASPELTLTQAREPLNKHDHKVVQAKRTMATLFLLAMIPLVYLFIRHKVQIIPGGTLACTSGELLESALTLAAVTPPDRCTIAIATAYSVYAIMEWSLVFLDVGWDATSVLDFKHISFELIEHCDAGAATATSSSSKKAK